MHTFHTNVFVRIFTCLHQYVHTRMTQKSDARKKDD